MEFQTEWRGKWQLIKESRNHKLSSAFNVPVTTIHNAVAETAADHDSPMNNTDKKNVIYGEHVDFSQVQQHLQVFVWGFLGLQLGLHSVSAVSDMLDINTL